MKRGSWENLGEKWVQCLRKSLNPGHTLAPPLIFIISNKTITYDCWLQQFFRQFCLFVNFGHVHWPPPVDSLCVDCYYSRWLKTVLILELIQRSEEKRLWFDSFLTLTVFDSVLLFLSLLLWWWPTVVSLPQEEKKKQMFNFRRRQESEKYKFFKLSTEKKNKSWDFWSDSNLWRLWHEAFWEEESLCRHLFPELCRVSHTTTWHYVVSSLILCHYLHCCDLSSHTKHKARAQTASEKTAVN